MPMPVAAAVKLKSHEQQQQHTTAVQEQRKGEGRKQSALKKKTSIIKPLHEVKDGVVRFPLVPVLCYLCLIVLSLFLVCHDPKSLRAAECVPSWRLFMKLTRVSRAFSERGVAYTL